MEKGFRVTGPLWGASTGHRWIPSKRPVTRSFAVFFLSAPEQMAEQTIEMPVIREPSRVSWRHFSDYFNGT